MRARVRGYVEVVKWDGSDEAARRLGLISLPLGHAPSVRAWHLPTENGPRMMVTGDWIVTRNNERFIVADRDFCKNYEVM